MGLHLLLPIDRGRVEPTRSRPGHPGGNLVGRPALGASALVRLTDGRSLRAQVDGGNGHSGKRSFDLHFGLGRAESKTALEVELRTPKFFGGWCALVDFLLPAHITALAVSMLLYVNDRLWPIAFAAALAVGSKTLIRVPVGRGVRHCLNPSNAGIACTLLLFPWVGIAPPYQFTENLGGVGDWLLPMVIVLSGMLTR